MFDCSQTMLPRLLVLTAQCGIKNLMNDLTCELCQWCFDNDNRVAAMHILVKDNVVADRESRLDKRDIECQLNRDVFDRVNHISVCFEKDLFASRLNNQVTKYVSWKWDLGVWVINALLVDWQSLGQMYFSSIYFTTSSFSKDGQGKSGCSGDFAVMDNSKLVATNASEAYQCTNSA